ncbi:MAG: hypothetical protein OEY85_15455, partial [Rhodospirillales bacterium]|nr:hypothetical protein [Rhodospirillales bacterium]
MTNATGIWTMSAMQKRYWVVLRFLVLLAAPLTSACMVLPGVLPDMESDAGFDQARAVEVFESGFESIHERYIEKIPVSELALNGLKGLGAIDPALTVSRNGEKVILSYENKDSSQFSVGQDMSVHDWAMLTARVVQRGRKISKELIGASDEKIYEAIFDGSLASLDIFSRYAGAEEAKNNR